MSAPKQPVINTVLITYIDYSITENLYRKDGVLLAVHTSGASPQSSASHLLTFLVAQLQFLREWELSDRRLYEVFVRRLLIWGNLKERNRRQIYLVSVGAKEHAFFLRHPVYIYRVSQEECARLRESVPYVKVYRHNPKHLYPKLNGYGDNGQRKVGAACDSKYCNLHSWCVTRERWWPWEWNAVLIVPAWRLVACTGDGSAM